MSDVANEIVIYDEMCRAIDAAYEIDEISEIRDQALVLELYARQKNNVEAERRVCEIRLRAERKLGRRISAIERIPGKRTDIPTSRQADGRSLSDTLREAGISDTQARRWQKLAEVPEDQFEATFADPNKKPSTSGIIAAHKPAAPIVIDVEPPKPPKPPHPDALWLWGRLLDFERDGLLAKDPNTLVGTMLDHMRTTTLELAPLVAAWLERINQ